MSNKQVLAALPTCAALMAPGAADAGGFGTTLRDGVFHASLEGLYLHRSTCDMQFIQPNSSGDSLNSDDASLGGGGGVRFTGWVVNDGVEGWCGNGTGLMISGMYTSHDGSHTLVPVGNDAEWECMNEENFMPVDAWESVDTSTISAEATLFGFEVNHLCPVNDSWILFGGSRFLCLQEDFDATSTSSNEGFVTAQQNVDISNKLIGLQVGAMGEVPFGDNISLCVTGKSGVFVNRINRDFYYLSSQQEAMFSGSSNRTKAAGVFEGNLTICFEPTKNVRLFAGGTFMYLTGVAVGPGNLPMANSEMEFAKKPVTKNAFYGGGTGGVIVIF